MAGYTAADNIFGFLYVIVNSFTQACMSFTSQNYGVGKWKRMDRVLVDCVILSVTVTFCCGSLVYFFGPNLLHIYTADSEVVQCGMEIFCHGRQFRRKLRFVLRSSRQQPYLYDDNLGRNDNVLVRSAAGKRQGHSQ